MAVYRNRYPTASTPARRRGQLLRSRNTTGNPAPVPGQGPPIIPGGQPADPPGVPGRPHGVNAQGYSPIRYGANNQRWGYAKVGQARNQPGATPAPGGGTPAPGGGGAGGGPLPTLTANQREALQSMYGGNNELNYGITAAPGNIGSYRRFLRQGLASGLSNKDINAFLNPAFYRSVSDPFGRSGLLKGLDTNAYKSLSDYASGLGTGGGPGAGTGPNSQANFFAANPALHQKYMSMANVYGKAPDLTNGMSTTPPNAVLGSDGKYHDPNMPLPQGVTLLDASTVRSPAQVETAAATDQGPQGRQAVARTPMMAEANGRKPEKHQAYWNSLGWVLNEATGEWTQHGGGGGQGGGGGGGGNGNGGGGNGNGNGNGGGGTPAPAPALSALPLDSTYEAQRRMAEDQLAASLSPLSGAREQIAAYGTLAGTRLQNNEDIDQQAVMDNLAGRGVFDSGLYATDRGDVATNYLRQNQDLGINLAGQYGDVSMAESNAQLSYSQQLQEALLDLAERMYNDPNAPIPGAQNQPGRNGRGNRNRPKWKPTWQPTWTPGGN